MSTKPFQEEKHHVLHTVNNDPNRLCQANIHVKDRTVQQKSRDCLMQITLTVAELLFHSDIYRRPRLIKPLRFFSFLFIPLPPLFVCCFCSGKMRTPWAMFNEINHPSLWRSWIHSNNSIMFTVLSPGIRKSWVGFRRSANTEKSDMWLKTGDCHAKLIY